MESAQREGLSERPSLFVFCPLFLKSSRDLAVVLDGAGKLRPPPCGWSAAWSRRPRATRR